MLSPPSMITKKPAEAEEAYFAKLEVEKKQKQVRERWTRMKSEEIEALAKIHAMHCAGCGFQLEPIVFKGLTVNKCFHCGGAFLSNDAFGQLCGEDNNVLESLIEIFQFK